MPEGSWGVGGPEHMASLSAMHKEEALGHRRMKSLALRQLRMIKKLKASGKAAGAKYVGPGRPRKKKKHAGRPKGSKSSMKARMAHARSFKKGGGRKKSSHRAHVAKAPGALVARYHSLKRAYHAAGLDLFKRKHGGMTPKEWSKKHRKAKHKRSR